MDYFAVAFLVFIFIGLPLLNFILDRLYIYKSTRDMLDAEKESWLENYYEDMEEYNCEF